RKAIAQTGQRLYQSPARDFIDNKALAPVAINAMRLRLPYLSDYAAIHYLINHESFGLDPALQDHIEKIEARTEFNPTKTQAEEILQRYSRIRHIMQQAVSEPDPLQKTLFTEKLDDL